MSIERVTCRFLGRLAALLVVAAMAACAPTRWENPNRPPDRWREDEAECRRLAGRESDQEVARDVMARGDPTMERSFEADMFRASVQRRQRGLFDDCMRQRGYQRVQTKTGG